MPVDVAILGSGALPVDLVAACQIAGLSAVLFEPDTDAAERAAFFLQKRGAGRVPVTGALADVASARLVLDAWSEGGPAAAALQDLFRGQVPVATLSPVTALGGITAQERVAGVSVAAPSHIRNLLEISPNPATSPETLVSLQDFADSLGKQVLTLPVGAPSLIDTLTDRMITDANELLLQGSTPWEVDESLEGYGFDLGLFAAQDLIGTDVAYYRRKATGAPLLIFDRAFEEGRLGQQVGWGWYRYPGGGGAVIDPLIEDLIREEAWFAKIDQTLPDDAPLAGILVSGLAQELHRYRQNWPDSNAGDLHQAVVSGIGFPAARSELLASGVPASIAGGPGST